MNETDSDDLAEFNRTARNDPAWSHKAMDFLRCGGWEVLQNPKYWTAGNRFDGAILAAMADVHIDAALRVGA